MVRKKIRLMPRNNWFVGRQIEEEEDEDSESESAESELSPCKKLKKGHSDGDVGGRRHEEEEEEGEEQEESEESAFPAAPPVGRQNEEEEDEDSESESAEGELNPCKKLKKDHSDVDVRGRRHEEEEEEEEGDHPQESEESAFPAARPKSSTSGLAKYQDCKDALFPPWIPKALSSLDMANARIANHHTLLASYAPDVCLYYLQKFRAAAMLLVDRTDAAILHAKNKQDYLQRLALEEDLSLLRGGLVRTQAQCSQQAALLKQAKQDLEKQQTIFRNEKEELKKQEAILTRHNRDLLDALKVAEEEFMREKGELERQLEEERNKSICVACYDNPRDTIILPCLHFQYCFACLLRHRSANSNTCPTCRGPIQGLNMSSCFPS